MNTLLAVLALLLTGLPIAAQTKILVAKNRTPIAIAGNYPGGIAFSTSCDEQGRLYVKLIEAGPGMVGPLFRLSSAGVVEAEFDTSGALINRYAARPDGGVIMIYLGGSTNLSTILLLMGRVSICKNQECTRRIKPGQLLNSCCPHSPKK